MTSNIDMRWRRQLRGKFQADLTRAGQAKRGRNQAARVAAAANARGNAMWRAGDRLDKVADIDVERSQDVESQIMFYMMLVQIARRSVAGLQRKRFALLQDMRRLRAGQMRATVFGHGVI